jgi:hypothetical protein
VIKKKTLTSEEEFEFWEEIEVRGSQIWGKVWMFQQFTLQLSYFSIAKTLLWAGALSR